MSTPENKTTLNATLDTLVDQVDDLIDGWKKQGPQGLSHLRQLAAGKFPEGWQEGAYHGTFDRLVKAKAALAVTEMEEAALAGESQDT